MQSRHLAYSLKDALSNSVTESNFQISMHLAVELLPLLSYRNYLSLHSLKLVKANGTFLHSVIFFRDNAHPICLTNDGIEDTEYFLLLFLSVKFNDKIFSLQYLH